MASLDGEIKDLWNMYSGHNVKCVCNDSHATVKGVGLTWASLGDHGVLCDGLWVDGQDIDLVFCIALVSRLGGARFLE